MITADELIRRLNPGESEEWYKVHLEFAAAVGRTPPIAWRPIKPTFCPRKQAWVVNGDSLVGRRRQLMTEYIWSSAMVDALDHRDNTLAAVKPVLVFGGWSDALATPINKFGPVVVAVVALGLLLQRLLYLARLYAA